MQKEKFIYFFRGDLSSHVDIYLSWFNVAKNSINISIITVIDYATYIKQKKHVYHYKSKDIKIFVVPKYTKKIFTIIYFFYLNLIYKRVVVHLRKQSTNPFDLLKKIFREQLKYIIEIEGDFESELDYLTQKQNNYKTGFYDSIIRSIKKSAKDLPKELVRADAVFVVTDELKELFKKRYTINEIEKKIHVIPTGFDNKKFYPDNVLREVYRRKYNLEDKFVLIYSGNVWYSWQNLKRSLEVFKILKKKFNQNMYFVMLVRKQDHPIAIEFIKEIGLNSDEYLLTNVSHDEVNGFLNAADLGILLRENHTLNKVASPGKLGEYLMAGLNVITTTHIGNYSKKMQENNIGILIDDIYDDSEILNKTSHFKRDITKLELSKWASDNFSVQAYENIYINALRKLNC